MYSFFGRHLATPRGVGTPTLGSPALDDIALASNETSDSHIKYIFDEAYSQICSYRSRISRDTLHTEPLFPPLPLHHINVSSIHMIVDLTYSPESLCFIVYRSRIADGATLWTWFLTMMMMDGRLWSSMVIMVAAEHGFLIQLDCSLHLCGTFFVQILKLQIHW